MYKDMRNIEINGYQHYWNHKGLVEDIVNSLPINDMNLPVGIYRFDMLDLAELKALRKARDASRDVMTIGSQKNLVSESSDLGSSVHSLSTDTDAPVEESTSLAPRFNADHQYDIYLQSAFKPLAYMEGWPTYPDGRPFWTRIEYESQEAHDIFEKWLYMPQNEQRPRSLYELHHLFLAENVSIDMALLQVWYGIHYWGVRAKAYDLFAQAQSRKQMEIRSMNVVDDHWQQSSRLMNRLLEYIEATGEDAEFWELMTPKNAIDMYKLLVQQQRLSSGLPAAAPPTGDKNVVQTPGQSMLDLLKDMGGAQGVELEDNSEEMLTRALENPDVALAAQQLIISMRDK